MHVFIPLVSCLPRTLHTRARARMLGWRACGWRMPPPPPPPPPLNAAPAPFRRRYGGYSEGVNEFGVGIGNEYFPSKHLPTDDGRAPQMEFTDLDRLVLERSKTAAEAVQVLTSLVSQYGQTCKRCPEAANYNSMFMVVDTTEVYSVMAVGHEWAWKRFDEASTNGTGIWTISNYRFLGATNWSSTAEASPPLAMLPLSSLPAGCLRRRCRSLLRGALRAVRRVFVCAWQAARAGLSVARAAATTQPRTSGAHVGFARHGRSARANTQPD